MRTTAASSASTSVPTTTTRSASGGRSSMRRRRRSGASGRQSAAKIHAVGNSHTLSATRSKSVDGSPRRCCVNSACASAAFRYSSGTATAMYVVSFDANDSARPTENSSSQRSR